MADKCIKIGDENFLPLLGRGTVASSLAEWRQRVTTHSGLLVRRVKDDTSNIHGYTIGEERIYTKLDATKSKSYSGSGSVTASGAAGGVPVSGSLNASASRSNVENLSTTDHAIVTRTYAFKEETPTFPTELEKDLYKWIAECLGQMRRQSFVYNPADDDPVEKVEEYVTELIPGQHSNEWLEIEQIIEAYIEKKEVTDYVFSIALGVKEAESAHSTKKHTEKSGGGSIGATGNASVGFSGKGEKTDDKSQLEKKVIGRVKVSEETGDVSIEGEGVVKVGVIGISDLIQSVEIRGIVERKTEKYKTGLVEEENCYAPLVGPIVISCKQRINGPERKEVFWEVKEDGVVGGTTDGEKASRFYLDDKGKGRFCIHYYDETSNVQHRECNSRRVYVRRSQLPNAAQIRVAVSDGEYDKEQDLLFKVVTRFRDSGPCSVNDWQGNGDMVYLAVPKNRFLWWSKQLYIQMDYTSDGTTTPTITFSFVDAIATDRNSSALFFCSRPSTAQPPTASTTPTGGSHTVAPQPSTASATPTGGSHTVAPQPSTPSAPPTSATTNAHAAVPQPTASGTGLPTSSGTDGVTETSFKGTEATLQADDSPQAPDPLPPVYKPPPARRGQLLDGGSVDSDEDEESD